MLATRAAASRGPPRSCHVGRRRAEYSGAFPDHAVRQHHADVRAQRLSAARVADEHRLRLQHQRFRGRRFADVAEGPPHGEDGPRLALGTAQRRSNRHGPPGTFTFNAVGSDLPGVTNTGNPFASFLLGQVQTFSIDFQKTQIQERARFQEYFIQDDWKVSDRLTINPGPALHAELSVHGDQRPDRRVQPADAVARVSGHDPVRPLKKNNFGPRFGAVYRVTDKTIVSSGYGLVGSKWPASPRRSRRRRFRFCRGHAAALDNISPAFLLEKGPTVTPVDPSPTAGLGQGVFAVDGTLGFGLCATVERVGAAGADDEHGRRVRTWDRRLRTSESRTAISIN